MGCYQGIETSMIFLIKFCGDDLLIEMCELIEECVIIFVAKQLKVRESISMKFD